MYNVKTAVNILPKFFMLLLILDTMSNGT